MPRAQRIAFVAPRFSEHGTVGGAETLLKALAERAAADGREVDFLTTCADDHFTWKNTLPPGVTRHGGLNVHRFPVNEHRDVRTFERIQGLIDSGAEISREDEEAWIANSVNSDALIAHLEEKIDTYDRVIAGPYLFGVTWFACRAAGKKAVLVPCLHDEAFAYLTIIRDMLLNVGELMFNTEPEKQLADRIHHTGDKGSVVGMGIEPFQADPGAFAKRHGLTRPYVVYAGRRETLKGTPLLTAYVHAFRERTGRDIGIVFTGSGPIEAPPGLEDAILDVGFVSEQEKHEAMAGAVCFIHPSVNESLGIVLLESWLAGTPALVHACGDVLRDQCRRSGGGLWFKYYPEFEEMLTRILDDEALRHGMAVAGRNFVLSEYSWDAVDKRLFAVLDGEPA